MKSVIVSLALASGMAGAYAQDRASAPAATPAPAPAAKTADGAKPADGAPAAGAPGKPDSKPPAAGKSPQHFEPTEKVRPDFDVAFPVDI